jgi:hypothetical protein
MKSNTLVALLLLAGTFPAYGYQKLCYIHPQYGRKGSLNDLKCILGKHFDECKHDYEVCSGDGRKTCHIRLNKAEMAHARLYLEQCSDSADTPIADEKVQDLLSSRKTNLKTVGLILRDFKHYNKAITLQQVRCSLGLDKK